ncbi:MAG: alpha/beta hydrolase, partial [Advenella sp.]|nr:alpha/beta hydrolase [Advenella sp.]
CAQNGLVAVRPNFRGVGLSEGEFDRAQGETRDMQMLIQQIEQLYPEVGHKKWVLAGFSFGTAVAAQLYAEQKQAQHKLPDAMMLLGPAVWRFQYRDIELPADLLVVHGEKDEVVPLQEVFDWIRPFQIPVTVMPEATHFFHGFLLQLKKLIQIRLDQILK